MKYGRLTIISEPFEKKVGKSGYYKFVYAECECGTIKSYRLDGLKSKTTQSCGCLANDIFKQNVTKHGMSGTRIYKIWKGVNARCRDIKNIHYGLKGIKVCDDWKNDFMNFYNWAINNGYDDSLTIDRIDNQGDYQPSNCRWVTHSANTVYSNKNRKDKFIYTGVSPNGEVVTFTNTAKFKEEYGIDPRRIGECCNSKRTNIYGWKFTKMPNQ